MTILPIYRICTNTRRQELTTRERYTLAYREARTAYHTNDYEMFCALVHFDNRNYTLPSIAMFVKRQHPHKSLKYLKPIVTRWSRYESRERRAAFSSQDKNITP